VKEIAAMSWLEGVGIPYLALAALAVIEGLGALETLARKFLELGIDAGILGIGVSGALLSGKQVQTDYAVALLFVELIIIGLSLHLRKWDRWSEENRASVSLFLGFLILGINTSIVLS
jgi:hypothetical protein